jgi:hypothetical protein
VEKTIFHRPASERSNPGYIGRSFLLLFFVCLEFITETGRSIRESWPKKKKLIMNTF